MSIFKVLLGCVVAAGLTACSEGARDSEVQSTHADTTPGALAAGTTVQATIQDSIRSGVSVRGGTVKAIVSRHVLDAGGRVVIPGGSAILLVITGIAPSTNPPVADGVIALDVRSASVRDSTRLIQGSVGTVPHTLKGREVVVTPGTPITITLTKPLTISAI